MKEKYFYTYHKNADGIYVVNVIKSDGTQCEIVDKANIIPKMVKADGISVFEAVAKLLMDF